MPKVSVIIPVYSVEKYIHRNITSVIGQTQKDIEIILVDDGSLDRCPEICESYALKDSRINVIHKKNGGLSSARNAGLSIAKGEYVSFIDSDDDIDLNMFEEMYCMAIKEEVDYVMSDYIRITRDGRRENHSLNIREGKYDKADIRTIIFPSLIMGDNLDYGPCLPVWVAIYKRDFLEHYSIKFDEDVYWSEDNIFSAIVNYHANSMYYMKGCTFYHYYQNPGTITTSYRKGAWNVYCTMNKHLHEYFDTIDDYDFSRQLNLNLIYYACCSIGQVKCAEVGFFKQVKMIKSVMITEDLRKTFQEFKIPNFWPLKLKIQVILLRWKAALLYRMVILQ